MNSAVPRRLISKGTTPLLTKSSKHLLRPPVLLRLEPQEIRSIELIPFPHARLGRNQRTEGCELSLLEGAKAKHSARMSDRNGAESIQQLQKPGEMMEARLPAVRAATEHFHRVHVTSVR